MSLIERYLNADHKSKIGRDLFLFMNVGLML